jgi:hypothetical protein
MPETGTPQDRFDRGEAEWVLDPSNDQLAAAKAAEEKARVALLDVQTKTRGRFATEALAQRDEEIGRVIAPRRGAGEIPTTQPAVAGELIPGTGITSDTILPGLKYPLRRYKTESLRRMAGKKTERVGSSSTGFASTCATCN